ncbi:MAG TPA: protocatechuate 3,4-dioxygenase subunit alpha [Gaiellaceae bacterium]|nr:protocatechuate 3,4-dioxygenase subunit alpha [Gaiellaceae bacterium]
MTEIALTPSQTSGPYLEIGLIGGPTSNHLVDDSDRRAIRISGLLIDGAGDPVPDGMIEIWQANAAGRYAHPADDREEIPVEEEFTGFGRSATDGTGRFAFVTVKPGRVPWADGRLQAPHLLVGVFARGLLKRVATRMYFPDEEAANAEDPVLVGLEPEERARLVARAEEGELRFDVVLQGRGQTTFFAV